MYATCLGLILKGYNDYENKRKQFEPKYAKISIPQGLQHSSIDENPIDEPGERMNVVKPRKTLKSFLDSCKNGLIEMFKDEGDSEL
jgi:cell division protein FtsA